MGLSEEDIKFKVVIDYLRSLGFEKDELEFEKSFFLRLGRHTYKVGTGEQKENARARLDILVKRNGNNLFVVEVKRDPENLTQEDKEQAISYARLVHPMAPLAIVTNGRDFKIYKVGDKTEIDKDKTKILGYNIGQDMQVLYDEAFEFFIGYSHDNVKAFCQVQLLEGMKTLLGSQEEPFKKFIPDLYVPSKNVARNFAEFIASHKTVFAIVGESGSGKTCAMCGLALDFSQRHPVLFYRALNLTEGPIKSIADDFNWEFSTQHDEIVIFKRINRIFKDKKIIIFIDGVDEWDYPNKVEILGNFASKMKDKNIKLVISCKGSHWEKFLSRSGTPTSLSEEVFSVAEHGKGCWIQPFDDEEIHNLTKKYRQFYNWKGYLDSSVVEEFKRVPFLLRIFFEVGRRKNYPHLTFSIKEFYDEYFEAVLERISHADRGKANRTILAIAKIVFERNVDTVDQPTLYEELKLTVSDEILPALFEYHILEKATSGLECQIGFYFKKFRDYVIAFGVNKWDKMSVAEFHESWRKLNLEGVQLDAVRLFYQSADLEKKRIIDEPLRSRAEAYLDFYVSIIGEHFRYFKDRFSPHKDGGIGFIADLDIRNKFLRAYGFRSINTADEKVKFVPFEDGFWNLKGVDRHGFEYFTNASGMHYYGSSNGFTSIDVRREVLLYEIVNQLEDIIDRGQLNETNNYYLALEKTLGIVVRRQSKIHGIENKRKLSQYLPIAIEKVEYGQRYLQAKRYFEKEREKEKIQQEIIKPVWDGTGYAYHVSWTHEDFEFIHNKAHEAAKAGKEFEATDIDIWKEGRVLRESLPIIRKRKGAIVETILPDEEVIASTGWLYDFFTKETLTSFIGRIYKIFLEEYKILVESNFSTLKSHFSLYSKMPVRFFIIIGEGDHDFSIKVYKCMNNASGENMVTLCHWNEIVFEDFVSRTFTYQDKVFAAYEISGRGISSILLPKAKFIDIDIPWEFAILRHMVYQQIKKELPIVTRELLNRHDINRMV